ncbi:acid sphingomyelinase-like phosphodiesterase 3b [Tupaia chinensis]|uniref:acid sphingomyelinase-like phosphodiesterase 3b n=1 Tax=Tupaia chinensis TaxID=246437 RepID=UPI00070433E7|nr:acid sphingomyelinase-like phosphodiesterase 3b [Tupaia chinensis]
MPAASSAFSGATNAFPRTSEPISARDVSQANQRPRTRRPSPGRACPSRAGRRCGHLSYGRRFRSAQARRHRTCHGASANAAVHTPLPRAGRKHPAEAPCVTSGLACLLPPISGQSEAVALARSCSSRPSRRRPVRGPVRPARSRPPGSPRSSSALGRDGFKKAAGRRPPRSGLGRWAVGRPPLPAPQTVRSCPCDPVTDASSGPGRSAPRGPKRVSRLAGQASRGASGHLRAAPSRGEPGEVGFLRRKFWHISDLHLDPDYQVSEDPLQVCPSAGSQPVPSAGPWGDYLCDSPWVLINSSIHAMKELEPEPDFILWTGDDTPHVPDERLGEAAVLEIVGRVTRLIREVFPDTKVYAALGNHDFHPKNQFPAGSSDIYTRVAELWSPWLSNESMALFKEGAFYTEQLPGLGRAGRVLVLNTNLHYSANAQTAGMADPGGQLEWLDGVLTQAAHAGEKVYISGHVPPGFFEKTRNKAWFREDLNEQYLQLVRKHHQVIAGQFFGHHHTDSFRLFYDQAGAPISAMFLTPGVSPWKTTLPGVANGANNPGIRVFEYDRATLSLQDMVTYFMNLSQANAQGTPRWELEYRLTQAYGVRDASARSMHEALGRITGNRDALQRYFVYNSVGYDAGACDERCRTEHVCAMRHVAFAAYYACLGSTDPASRPAPAPWLLLLLLLLALQAVLVRCPDGVAAASRAPSAPRSPRTAGLCGE